VTGLIKFLAGIYVMKVVFQRWRAERKAGAAPTFASRPPAADTEVGRGREKEKASPSTSRAGTDPAHEATADVDTPLDLPSRDWKTTVKAALKEVKEDRVTLVAAGMAYYFFLAVFPALIAVVGIMGLVKADSSGLVHSVETTLPGESGEAVTEAFEEADKPSDATSLTASVLGIGLALWSGSSGMVALQSGLNVAYDVPSDRKFVGKRAVALVLLIATGLLGGAPSPLFAFGDSVLFDILGWGLTIVAVCVLFSLFFFIGPNRDTPRWQWVSVGGATGAALWIAASLIFGFYIDHYSNYSKTYGSLAGVIVLILWLYLSSLAVLVGGELNAELERTGARRAVQS
jgi:membrane protein